VLIIIPPAYVGAWLNENYVESSAMQKRWPLHPKPYSNETLERYVRRLAECYDVRYEHFCRRALGIPADDSQARRFQEPTPELLQRLSDGTGISVGLLEQMTLSRILHRLMEEIRQYTETPEGRAELENFTNRRLSQNS
jgi:hypothetical protein